MNCMKKWKPKFHQPHFRRLKKRKPLTKKKYQKNIDRSFKYIIQIVACVFLLGIVFVAIFKEVF